MTTSEAFKSVIDARFPHWDKYTIFVCALSLALIIIVSIFLRVKKGRIFCISLLYLYIYSVLVTTLLMRDVYPNVRYTFEITFISRILDERDKIAFAEAVLNFLLLMPVGFFMPLLINKHPFIKTVTFGLGLTLFIETTQLFTHLGEFQTDDVILNFAGCFVGAAMVCVVDGIFKGFRKLRKKREEKQ